MQKIFLSSCSRALLAWKSSTFTQKRIHTQNLPRARLSPALSGTTVSGWGKRKDSATEVKDLLLPCQTGPQTQQYGAQSLASGSCCSLQPSHSHPGGALTALRHHPSSDEANFENWKNEGPKQLIIREIYHIASLGALMTSPTLHCCH